METVIIILGLFFMITWSFGIYARPEYRTTININLVIWWWISFLILILIGSSSWHLLWLMPSTAFLNAITAMSFGSRIGFILGGIPTLIMYFIS